MASIIEFDNIKKITNDDEDRSPEHQIISFAEMNEGIDDARLLHGKISLFAKKLIEEGFNDKDVYMQLFKTACSMSCLFSDDHEQFLRSSHERIAKFHECLCYEHLGIDDIV